MFVSFVSIVLRCFAHPLHPLRHLVAMNIVLEEANLYLVAMYRGGVEQNGQRCRVVIEIRTLLSLHPTGFAHLRSQNMHPEQSWES